MGALYQKDPENKVKEDELCKAYETVLIKAGYPESYAKDVAYKVYGDVKPHVKEDMSEDQLKEFAKKVTEGMIKGGDDYDKPAVKIDENFIPDLEKSLFDLMVL